MNLVLLFDSDFIDRDRVRLTGRRFVHLRDVHRTGTGDTLRVGLLQGKTGTGTVVALEAEHVELSVHLDRAPPPPLPLTLLLALPRPKALRRVLHAITTMGVKRVILFNTWRVEKSYWSSPLLGDAALRAELLLGLEQACDTVLPEVSLRRRFKPFVEDELPALAAGTTALVADPAAALELPRAASTPITLAIGPEGGFTPYELDMLAARGFTPVRLGLRPLRVEHAVVALLARLLPFA